MGRTLCRIVVVLATFGAGLTLASSPASAAGVFYFKNLSGSYLRLAHLGGSEYIPVSATAGDYCSGWGVISETATPTLRIGGFSSSSRFTITTSTQYYVAMVRSENATHGAITTQGATGHKATVSFTLGVRIFVASNQSATSNSCGIASQTPICQWTANHTVEASWTGSSLTDNGRVVTVTDANGASSQDIDGCASQDFPMPLTIVQYLDSVTIQTEPEQAGSHNLTPTGGTVVALNATGTSTITGTIGGTTGSGCASTLTTYVDPGAETINVTAFSSTGHFTLNSNHYVATMTRTASTSGTLSHTSGTISSVGISVSVAIRAAANNTSSNVDCTTTGTTLCTLRATLTLSGTSDPGDAYYVDVSTTFTVSTNSAATITLGIGTCQVPFATFNGGTASISGLTAHVTT